MQRFFFTLKAGFKARRKLREIRQKQYQINRVTDITPDFLNRRNIHCLVIDFDGVLASHGAVLPDKSSENWLNNLSQNFPKSRIFILSNKPTGVRAAYFKKHFPNIQFISGVRKKPYPDGLLKIQEITGFKAYEIALVDDRILTGCLACILAGSYPILVTSPSIKFSKKPIQECFFAGLRAIERWLLLK